MAKDAKGRHIQLGDIVDYDPEENVAETLFSEVPEEFHGAEAQIVELDRNPSKVHIQFKGDEDRYKVAAGAVIFKKRLPLSPREHEHDKKEEKPTGEE